MLTCLPLGLCSRDFRVTGEAEALVTFAWSEQGAIVLDGQQYEVRKHGWGSGRWTLEREGRVHADARKTGILTRTIEIRTGASLVTLRPQFFSRQFNLEVDGRTVGAVLPMHAFTRRAAVDCGSALPVLVQLFAFWLVAMMWRRAANNSAAGGT